MRDDFAESPASALRFISRALRRTGVRLAPRDLRALNPGFDRRRPGYGAESLVFALRFISRALRRTGSTPRAARFARLESGL